MGKSTPKKVLTPYKMVKHELMTKKGEMRHPGVTSPFDCNKSRYHSVKVYPGLLRKVKDCPLGMSDFQCLYSQTSWG